MLNHAFALASDVEFVVAAFPRHARHKQFLYFARNSFLVSSLNLISPHQQPLPKEISQANISPQASHAWVFRNTGKLRPICFNSFISFSSAHLLLSHSSIKQTNPTLSELERTAKRM